MVVLELVEWCFLWFQVADWSVLNCRLHPVRIAPVELDQCLEPIRVGVECRFPMPPLVGTEDQNWHLRLVAVPMPPLVGTGDRNRHLRLVAVPTLPLVGTGDQNRHLRLVAVPMLRLVGAEDRNQHLQLVAVPTLHLLLLWLRHRGRVEHQLPEQRPDRRHLVDQLHWIDLLQAHRLRPVHRL